MTAPFASMRPQPMRAPNGDTRPARLLPMLVGVGGVYLLVLGWSMANTDYDLWGGLLLLPFLMAASVPAFSHVARTDTDPRIIRLVSAALVAKMLGAVARYIIAFDVYGGSADAGLYHSTGKRLAEGFWRGDLSWGFVESVVRQGKITDTGFIDFVTGIAYTFITPSRLGGFFFFSWLSFWGLFMFWRAFRIALPEWDERRYALLVFFLPSLVFWPSSIGKESWMLFALGLCAYGAARIMVRRPGGYLLAGLGIWAAAMPRPHVATIAMAALFGGYLLRRPPQATLLGPVVKGVGVIVLMLGSVLLLGQVQDHFKLDDVSSDSVNSVFEETQDRSEQGGSGFDAKGVRNPAEFPIAIVNVLFRPFPSDAHNLQAIVASLEGTMLLLLVLAGYERIRRLPLMAVRRAYVGMSTAFVLGFCWAFSNVGNFGILTRQRAQVLPFLLVLLCIPTVQQEKEQEAKAAREAELAKLKAANPVPKRREIRTRLPLHAR